MKSKIFRQAALLLFLLVLGWQEANATDWLTAMVSPAISATNLYTGYDIVALDDTTIIGVGANNSAKGTIIRSTDGGNTWTPTATTAGTFYRVYFTSDSVGFALGIGGAFAQTTDRGLTWTVPTSPFGTSSMMNMYVASQTTMYAVGASGQVYKTTDSGSSWTALIVPSSTYTLYGVCFTNDTTGYVCGASGKMYKTTNDGSSWTALTQSLATGSLYDIKFINDSVGFVCGAKGIVLKTTDRGTTWTKLTTPSTTANYYKLFISNDSTIYTSSYSSASSVIKSTNQGASFTALTTPGTDYISRIVADNNSNMYAIGRRSNYGLVLKLNAFGVASNALNLSAAEQDTTIAITPLTSNTSWMVTSNSSWLSVSPASGSDTSSFVSHALANTGISTRTGSITIKNVATKASQAISITQASSAYITTVDTINVSKNAGTAMLNVSSNIEWAISTTDTTVATINVDTLSGSQTVNINVAGNAGIIRKATFTLTPITENTGLSSKTVVLVQDGETPYLTVPDTFEISGTNYYVYKPMTLKTNTKWSTSLSTSNIGVLNGSGDGDGSPAIGVSSKTLALNRTTLTSTIVGTATFKATNTINALSKTVYIKLPGVNVASLFADSSSSTVAFTYDNKWTATTSDSWLSVSPSSGTSGSTLTYTATTNTFDSLRVGVITIKDSTGAEIYSFKVLQVSATPIKLSNSNMREFYSNFDLESTTYPNKANYELTEDITVPWTDALGCSLNILWGLAGTFDGAGHSLLVQMNPSTSSYKDNLNMLQYTAMFRVIESTGKVYRLSLTGYHNGDSTAYDYQGFLAGINFGTVEQVAFHGFLYGGKFLSQACAYYSTSNVGVVKDCYNSGRVTGTQDNSSSAPIAFSSASTKNCLTYGYFYAGIGYPVAGDGGRTSLFYNIDSIKAQTSIYSNLSGTTGLSTAQLKDSLERYKNAGWDISDSARGTSVWYMMNGEDYPHLRWEMAGPITVNSTTGGETTVSPYRKGLYLKNTTITVSANPNLGYEFKYFLINGDSTVTDDVLQFAANDSMNIQVVYEKTPYLTTSESELSVAYTANTTGQFTISSNVAWTVISSESWLTPSVTSGSGDTSVVLSAAANNTTSERTATITISGTDVASKTITVTQAAGNATGIEATKASDGISIYPNPVENILTVQASDMSIANIVVSDISGKKMLESKSTTIDLSALSSGTYIVNIYTSKGLVTKQIVKK